MIVKNESKIITRMFDSVVSIIDCYCICDTGSTDETVKIITEYFLSKNIPGKVVTEPFRNFCHNRNFSLNACMGMSDYVLLLDADMVLKVRENFNKNKLRECDSWFILQGNEGFYYQNLRVVKNNGLYNYVGVTHEYIDTPPTDRKSTFKKDELFILDVGDGGAKSDKFERDVRLLKQGIIDEPNNVRYYFYLANSYHDSGHYDDAIENYKKRIEMGGWIEELFYSYYRIGCCYSKMGKMSDAVFNWLLSFDLYPDRLEGIYEVIKHFRWLGKQRLSYVYYEAAKKILDKKNNRDSYLFLHNEVYTHKVYFELTILGSWIGIKNVNNEVVEVLNHSHDGSEINNLLSNMKFYKDILIPNGKIVMTNERMIDVNGEPTKFYSSSSSLIKDPNSDGYLMNVRYVNYYITDGGSYLYCDRWIITVNRYVELDKDLNVKTDKWFNLVFDDRRYIGIEDVRIFSDCKTDKLLFMGTGYHQSNQIGIVKGDYDITKDSLTFKEIVPSFNNSDCEKNWVFVEFQNETHVIYNWHPLQLCKIDEDTNTLNLVSTGEMPRIFSRARGSTGGYRYSRKVGEVAPSGGNMKIDVEESELWFVVHIVSYESPRHYYHVIAVFDDNMKLKRYSAPFKFEGDCIEYCIGIVVEDDRVLMTYSNWDRTTKIGVYDKAYIDKMVKYT
jgi:tetratricopeptide (TPR) repeat protein